MNGLLGLVVLGQEVIPSGCDAKGSNIPFESIVKTAEFDTCAVTCRILVSPLNEGQSLRYAI